ncbi:hypothetical protein V2J09_015106 [Rumex salicifolius]
MDPKPNNTQTLSAGGKRIRSGGKIPHKTLSPRRSHFAIHSPLILTKAFRDSNRMMFSSQIDGGFTASQSTQSDTAAPPSRNRDDQRLMPVTVKQISQASHSTGDKSIYQIDGVDVSNVKLVGMVSNKVERVTDVTFTIDDGTGSIGCKRWKTATFRDRNKFLNSDRLNEPFDRKQTEALEEGAYVRLVGHLKTFQDKPSVVAFSVWPVTDFNEVTHHFIECIHNHLKSSTSRPKADSLSQSQMVDASQRTTVKVESTPSNQMNVDGLKTVDQMVLDYLQQPSSLEEDKGVHRDEIAKHLKLSTQKIIESITCLEEEGLIYSTIDEYHFKSTSS